MKTDQELKQAIDQIDSGRLVRKLCASFEDNGYGWPEEEAIEQVNFYKEFLFKIAKDKQQRPADRLQDIVWHTHILMTRSYHDDCQRIFGHFLHHEPDIK